MGPSNSTKYGPSVHNPSGQIPNDEEIPLLLNKVYPCHEVVKIDYHLPGCPPSADTLWEIGRAQVLTPVTASNIVCRL